MFEDTIPRDENIICLASRQAPLSPWIHHFFELNLDDFLSKDSDLTRYNYSRLNGMVPENPSFFSSAYPRKSSTLDTDLHHLHFDVHFLTRWFPRDVLRLFIPVLYFQDLQNERMEKRAAKLSGNPVPTVTELQTCAKLRGHGFWTRKGVWRCSRQNLADLLDEHGKRFFSSYDEFIVWEAKLDEKISHAKHVGDYETLRQLRTARS